MKPINTWVRYSTGWCVGKVTRKFRNGKTIYGCLGAEVGPNEKETLGCKTPKQIKILLEQNRLGFWSDEPTRGSQVGRWFWLDPTTTKIIFDD